LDAVSAEKRGGHWNVKGRIIQTEPYFRFPLNLALDTGQNTTARTITVSGPTTSFELSCDGSPLKLAADPADDVMRWLYPAEIPPAVNTLKSAPSVLTVLPAKPDPALEKAARTLVLSLGLKDNKFVTEDEVNPQLLAESSILLIGRPRTDDLLRRIPRGLDIGRKSFTLDGSLYDKPSDAFFGVFKHPFAEGRSVALFMPLSSEYADVVAAKITHYGKYSYLIFQNGSNRGKGFWPVEASPLVFQWHKRGGE
jgi:hypothetical protein